MKSKHFAIIIVLASLIGFLAFNNAFKNYSVSYPVEIEESLAIYPKPSNMKLRVKLYFPYREHLNFEERVITVNERKTELAIAEEIMKGPKNKFYGSPFSDIVEIKSVHVANNICYINLSEEFLNQEYMKGDDADLYVWSIINTFTSVDDIYAVQILVDGQKMDFMVGGKNLKNILENNEELNYQKTVYPSDVVIKFSDAVMDYRYDIAYNLISRDSQLKYSYNEFKSASEEHFMLLRGYRRNIYFTQDFSESWIIYVKYVFVDKLEPENESTKFDLWELIKEDNQWRVVFDK
jgi:hypothetical protein